MKVYLFVCNDRRDYGFLFCVYSEKYLFEKLVRKLAKAIQYVY